MFLALICLPLSGLILGLDRTFVLLENRNLAAWPVMKLDRATFGALPDRFEAYFNDHFGFRKRLIYWLAIAKVQVFGVTSTPGVTLGSRGWLYLASDSAVLSFRAARPYTVLQLEAYRRIIEARRDWLASRGIAYLLVIAPNKDTIYPEFMPAGFNKLNSRSRLDQLANYMKSDHSDPDSRRPRRLAKSPAGRTGLRRHGQPLELRGGYVAYERIMRALVAVSSRSGSAAKGVS